MGLQASVCECYGEVHMGNPSLRGMIQLPEWDSQFVAKSTRHMRHMNVYRTGRASVICLVPWGQAAVLGTIGAERHSFTTGVFFCGLSVLFVLEQAGWVVKRRNGRRLCFCLLETLPALPVLCGSCMLWSLVPSGNLVLAIGLWWLTGFVLALVRYVARRWALREAVLQTRDHKLFKRRSGRLSKRTITCLESIPGLMTFSATRRLTGLSRSAK